MEENINSLSQDDKQDSDIPQAERPVTPAAPDPEDTYDTEQPINWKERLYDRIPDRKKALRFLDFFIPLLFVLIIVFLIIGMLRGAEQKEA